jgi:hypothetical protein
MEIIYWINLVAVILGLVPWISRAEIFMSKTAVICYIVIFLIASIINFIKSFISWKSNNSEWKKRLKFAYLLTIVYSLLIIFPSWIAAFDPLSFNLSLTLRYVLFEGLFSLTIPFLFLMGLFLILLSVISWIIRKKQPLLFSLILTLTALFVILIGLPIFLLFVNGLFTG